MVKSKKRKKHFNILDQWVEVTRKNGVTRTELYPPNDVLLEEGGKWTRRHCWSIAASTFLPASHPNMDGPDRMRERAFMAAVAYSA